MLWLSSIISIVLLYFAYAYLKGLKTCACANDLYATRLKNLESILLGFNVMIFCFAVLSSFHLFNALDKIKQHILKIAMVGGLIMLAYYSYFVYNGYSFWKSLPADCACADKWPKYYIYLQSIVYFLILTLTTTFVGVLAFRKIKTGLITETTLNRYIVKDKESFAKSSASKSSASASKRKSSKKRSSKK
jgi:drug/metabolite transporter (DMT)-like permease